MGLFSRKNESERTYKRGSINVSDAGARDRIQYMGLTEEDLGVIATYEEVCRAVNDHLVGEFYVHVLGNATTKAILSEHSSVERQRPLLTRYILTLFQGRIDDEYLAYRDAVGRRHDDIDLDSNWYVSMYEVIGRVIRAAVVESGANGAELTRFDDAFQRLLRLDVALCVTALQDSRTEKIKAMEQDQARLFVDEMAAVLSRMARKDLTVRVTGEYDGDFLRAKEEFNTALEDLNQALGAISRSSEQVAAGADEITSGSQALAEGASEQASSLEEVSASLEEMTSITQQNTASAREGQGLAEAASGATEKGVESMERLSVAVEKIKASSDATAKIVKTIDEIAFQTNLLALNAAVEAARAGDAGKGFAVVAEEVRNLAIRSADAAKSTAELIEESVENSERGVAINAEVVGQLTEINDGIGRVREVMGEITAASEQQGRGVEEISKAVEQMNTVTQANAANAEESASAAEELTGQARVVEGLVADFTLSDAERRTRAPGPPSPVRPTRAKTLERQSRDRKAPVAVNRLANADELIPFDDDGLGDF